MISHSNKLLDVHVARYCGTGREEHGGYRDQNKRPQANSKKLRQARTMRLTESRGPADRWPCSLGGEFLEPPGRVDRWPCGVACAEAHHRGSRKLLEFNLRALIYHGAAAA